MTRKKQDILGVSGIIFCILSIFSAMTVSILEANGFIEIGTKIILTEVLIVLSLVVAYRVYRWFMFLEDEPSKTWGKELTNEVIKPGCVISVVYSCFFFLISSFGLIEQNLKVWCFVIFVAFLGVGFWWLVDIYNKKHSHEPL